jgi:uncharacterized membrane protein YgaE (UPF0421/DUF939 family)
MPDRSLIQPIQWSQLRLALQTAFATVAAYVVAGLLGLPQRYWAVMTAILVVQASLGASLGLALERLLATVLGAVAGVAAVATLETGSFRTLLTLFLTVAGLTYFTSRPALRLAPVTAAIVILSSPDKGAVLFAAIDRVLEIGVGALVGVLTSLILFPRRSARALASHVAEMAPLMSQGFTHSIAAALREAPRKTDEELAAYGARVRAGLRAAESLTLSAQREVAGHLAWHADPASLLRSLRRVWHTEVMVMRASHPLAPGAGAELALALHGVSGAVEAYFGALSKTSVDRDAPLDSRGVADAVAILDDAIMAARRTGTFRSMSADDVARLFALTFALEQLPQNLADLSGRLADLRRGTPSPPAQPDLPVQLSNPSNRAVE